MGIDEEQRLLKEKKNLENPYSNLFGAYDFQA